MKLKSKAEQSLTFEISNTLKNEIPAYIGSLTREEGKNVGNYLISIGTLALVDNIVTTQGIKKEFLASNYELILSSTPVYYVIEKANVTIKVNDVVADYDGKNYVSNFTALISSDYIPDDILTLYYSCPVTEKTQKGVYPITLTVSHENYNFTIINATYTVNYKIYTVSFSVLGNIVSTVNVEHFSYVSAEAVPAVNVEGYIFESWEIRNNDGSYVEVIPTTYQINENTTFSASMRLTLYTITYNLNGGEFEGNCLETFKFTTNDFALDVPIKTGYNFAGWFKNSDFSGQPISIVTKGTTGDLVLFAKWIIKVYQVSLPVVQDNALNIVYEDPLQLEYQQSFTFLVELSDAYTQSSQTIQASVKWLASGRVEQLEQVKPLQYTISNIADNFEIVLTGINKNVYTVSFIADGKQIKIVQKEYGQSLLEEDYPQIPMEGKENYSDVDPYWETKDSYSNITKNEVVNAIYVPNVYTVTFVLPNGKNVTTSVTYGQKVSEDKLKEVCSLSLFEYFIFDSSLEGVSGNKTIKVSIGNNIYILYIVLAAIGCLIIFFVVLGVVKKKKRNKFDWWFYADEEDINPKAKKHTKK